MINGAIILRHLCFTGPNVEPAFLAFDRGLNILYGASETGKSFVLETIDYMLGGSVELRDIPERVGYDRILLGIESDDEAFTLVRSTSGGNFQLFEGLYQSLPSNLSSTILNSKHSSDTDNISAFLLNLIGLNQKRIKTNAKGKLRNLSFRDLCHFCLVDEGRIQHKRSPIENSGQFIFKTAEYSVFKLLLTGVDDSAVVSNTISTTLSQSKNSKIEFIDELLSSYLNKLPDDHTDYLDLKEQLEKLDLIISSELSALKSSETIYQELISRRNELRKKMDLSAVRKEEIFELNAKFSLLNSHYQSDLARLDGISEAGSLLAALELKSCPLCGASPNHQHPSEDSDGNLEIIVVAANVESQKIVRLQKELVETSNQLGKELNAFDALIPELLIEYKKLEIEIDGLAGKLLNSRMSYSELIDKRSRIHSLIALKDQIDDLRYRRTELENVSQTNTSGDVVNPSVVDLSSTILDRFAQHVELVLKAWNFPDADRVQFDTTTRDVIISGKHRGSRGKGMRSITHAAFSVSLLEFCKENESPHPGFLVIDSPLLAYREPEDQEDDLTKTDVQDKFYEYLSTWIDRQIIVIENINPPLSISALPLSVMFSKNPKQGRYGFFPSKGN